MDDNCEIQMCFFVIENFIITIMITTTISLYCEYNDENTFPLNFNITENGDCPVCY
jgi:hypothetical protein